MTTHTQTNHIPEPSRADAAATPLRLVVVSAGVSSPSTTRLLADRTAQKSIDLLREAGIPATVNVIELGPLAVEIAQAIVSGFPGERLQAAIELLAGADAVIASTPVYKAGISGLFKSFADVLDNDLLIAKPVILAATAGTARHAMVVDEQLRPLFAFLRAMPVPTSLFAAPDDWGSTKLLRNTWELAGDWTVASHAAVLNEPGGRIAFGFHARDVNLVMGPVEAGASVPFRVTLDGQPVGESAGTDVDADGRGAVTEQNTYQLVRRPGRVDDRVFGIEFEAAGVEAYCFTFG